jgi:hypothetical protein
VFLLFKGHHLPRVPHCLSSSAPAQVFSSKPKSSPPPKPSRPNASPSSCYRFDKNEGELFFEHSLLCVIASAPHKCRSRVAADGLFSRSGVTFLSLCFDFFFTVSRTCFGPALTDFKSEVIMKARQLSFFKAEAQEIISSSC